MESSRALVDLAYQLIQSRIISAYETVLSNTLSYGHGRSPRSLMDKTKATSLTYVSLWCISLGVVTRFQSPGYICSTVGTNMHLNAMQNCEN